MTGSTSDMSEETYPNGLAFSRLSTSTNPVWNTYSLTLGKLRMVYKAVLMDHISLSLMILRNAVLLGVEVEADLLCCKFFSGDQDTLD